VANVNNNMGTELMALGRPREALEHYRLAADDWKRRIGPSTEVVTGLNNLGSASLELGELAEAERDFGDALAMSDKVLGPTHLYSGVVLQGLGDTRLRLGKRDQALADYQRSIAIIEKALDPKNERLVGALLGIGRVYNERHDARARPPLERALAISEAQPGDGRELNEVRLALAEALWPTGKAAQATALATLARDNLAKLGPRAHRDLTEATAWLHDHH
jgi:tetratricopeptide (TPR) repeat protein